MARVIEESTLKQDEILLFIQENEPMPQSDIVRHFNKKKRFSTMNSARVSIGQLCKKLEIQGKIYKKHERNESRGQIDKNIWYYNRQQINQKRSHSTSQH